MWRTEIEMDVIDNNDNNYDSVDGSVFMNFQFNKMRVLTNKRERVEA